ncbi:BQ2448_7482 [Microbotryum intermedium]|uniref:Mitochondrial intermembrane space import and assembly protein 40 n=1 Tax=Microbotryum intermedium TaxID=269621 RepID=A0A238FR30_9BASI|nr:BQ2448_7482 [Microbotryum intermedium]
MSFRTAATSLRPLVPTQTPILSTRSALTFARRPFAARPATSLRHASSSATSRASSSTSSSASMNGVKAGSLALVGLVTWSGVLFYVGQQGVKGNKTHHEQELKHEVKAKVKQVKKDVGDKAKAVGAKVSEVKDKVGDKVDQVKEKVGEKVDEAKQGQFEGGVETWTGDFEFVAGVEFNVVSMTEDHSSSDRPDPDDPSSPQSAAFDPETGEINWDCPCLGGMADGPCGPEFKLAFSCFVYSEAEPKGVDCVEKFRGMQECFRKHPDIYGADDDADNDDDTFELVSAAQEALDLPEEEGIKL